MKKILFLISGILILLMPQICSASVLVIYDYAYYSLFSIAFLGIWMIGTVYIRNKLQDFSSRALLSVLAANLIGIFLSYFIITKIIQHYFGAYMHTVAVVWISVLGIIGFCIIFIFLEALILWLFYRNKKFKEMLSLSFFMNLRYTLFLLVFIFAVLIDQINLLIILLITTSAIIIPYTFFIIFGFVIRQREISKNKKIIAKVFIILLSFILVLIIAFSFIIPEKGLFNGALDTAIKAELLKLRDYFELYPNDTNGNSYDGFCDSQDNVYHFLAEKVRQRIDINYSVLYCNSLDTQWIACAQLVSEKDIYFCVDSDGNAVKNTGICDADLVKNNKPCL